MDGGTIFIAIWIVAIIFMLTILYTRGKKALSIFPDINTIKVVYRDKRASGHSNKSIKTKLGGARNALDIIVTDSEVWFKSMLLFASITERNDLLHKIPIEKIMKVSQKGNSLTIDFQSIEGKNKQIVLITQNPSELIKALKK
jgi:hypothetical protein